MDVQEWGRHLVGENEEDIGLAARLGRRGRFSLRCWGRRRVRACDAHHEGGLVRKPNGYLWRQEALLFCWIDELVFLLAAVCIYGTRWEDRRQKDNVERTESMRIGEYPGGTVEDIKGRWRRTVL